MFDLAPPGLDDRRLGDVLAAIVPELLDPPVRATLDVSEDVVAGAPSRVVVHRVIVEAVRNVNRHARAASVTVRVRQTDSSVVVDVTDDGVGFDVGADVPTGHFGLGIMRSLVDSLGGTFAVTSRSGAGTTVHFEVPA